MFSLQISNVDIYFKVLKMAMQFKEKIAAAAQAAAYGQGWG